MPELSEIAKIKISNIEEAPKVFIEGVAKSQFDLFSDIQGLVSELDTKDGLFVMSKKNLLIVDDISIKLKDVINKSDYFKAVNSFVDEFAKQALITNSYFYAFDAEVKINAFTAQLLKNAQNNALNKLVGTGIESNFLSPVKDILERSVSSGSGFQETLKSLREFSLGTLDKDGKILRYAKQIAFDLFAIADRSYTNAISSQNGYQWFLYSGDIIADSREFCVERHDKYYHKKEIEDWAALKWAGKDPTTTEQTIFELAGGFRCGHSILPVSVFSVPIEVVKRNVDNGNYKPTEKEKKELGI